MNVLMFVTVMIMLLSLMTYSKLDLYRHSQIFQVLFEHYMQKDERGYINIRAETVYDTTKGSKKEGKGNGQKVAASPRVSLAMLLNKTQRESTPQEAASFVVILKNLMNTLYAQQPFYQHLLAQRPSFVDEMISSMIQAVDQLPDEKKFKKAEGLANLVLGDDQLDDALYKILHGAPYKEVPGHSSAKEQIVQEQVQSDDDPSDASMVSKEAEEFHPPKGYFSLLGFLTMEPVNKVRIFLAPREVLKAIFLDDAIVEDVIRKRKELFHQAKLADADGIKGLGESFKTEFQGRQDAAVVDSILDYTVTKTNPKKYE